MALTANDERLAGLRGGPATYTVASQTLLQGLEAPFGLLETACASDTSMEQGQLDVSCGRDTPAVLISEGHHPGPPDPVPIDG